METFSQDVVLKRIFRQKLLLLTLIAIGIPSSLESGMSKMMKTIKLYATFTHLLLSILFCASSASLSASSLGLLEM